jgi:hypothetical protein
MTARRLLAVSVAAISFAPVSGACAELRSRALNWETHGETVACGVAEVFGSALDPASGAPLNGRWPGLQCSAQGLPHKGDVGDPFVQLGQGRAGRARLVDLSQDDLLSSSAPVGLSAGERWSRYGITCEVFSAAVSCHNTSAHGFTLSPGHLRLF